MQNDTSHEQLDTRTESDAEGTFEVREESSARSLVSEFDQAPLTDINFGF